MFGSRKLREYHGDPISHRDLTAASDGGNHIFMFLYIVNILRGLWECVRPSRREGLLRDLVRILSWEELGQVLIQLKTKMLGSSGKGGTGGGTSCPIPGCSQVVGRDAAKDAARSLNTVTGFTRVQLESVRTAGRQCTLTALPLLGLFEPVRRHVDIKYNGIQDGTSRKSWLMAVMGIAVPDGDALLNGNRPWQEPQTDFECK
ncbi:hypothetical protein BC826DRAFT_972400 [Russula brevipes]|nr:hypothetical protein BC826DRAFT_972400 [Russula brevipes]